PVPVPDPVPVPVPESADHVARHVDPDEERRQDAALGGRGRHGHACGFRSDHRPTPQLDRQALAEELPKADAHEPRVVTPRVLARLRGVKRRRERVAAERVDEQILTACEDAPSVRADPHTEAPEPAIDRIVARGRGVAHDDAARVGVERLPELRADLCLYADAEEATGGDAALILGAALLIAER